jgi:choline dehydrogenase-like flavoprotein
MTDVIVVGSGASAVHAAWALVEAGLSVCMLDVGQRDEVYETLIPDKSFSEIRRSDPEQHRYFLGDRFEGVTLGRLRVGAQLTPPRGFITRGTEDLTPVETDTFAGMESLARGGLASGWGAGVARFTDEDLARAPIKPSDLAPHYAAVEERIGVLR